MTPSECELGAGAACARDSQRGTSLAELLIVLAATLVVGAMAVPTLGSQNDRIATSGAARYLATRLQQGRMDAIRRGTHVAYRFERGGETVRYALFADGNGNGVRTTDIGTVRMRRCQHGNRCRTTSPE